MSSNLTQRSPVGYFIGCALLLAAAAVGAGRQGGPTAGGGLITGLAAFPGAEGFGADTPGGRGGVVIEVTNLNDSGPGSLRAALEATGPRTVVFRVGGTIVLQEGLEIENPFITIAGQSAPGGGILIRNDPSNTDTALRVRTHDVLIRHLRLRPGPSGQSASSLDALTISDGAYNVIVDHCSMSWGTDEVLQTWDASQDITIQWSIVSEGLDCATHTEGCHSTGMLLGSEGSRDLSIHHNFLAHNVRRNPLIKTSGVVDLVNNVIYNPESTASTVVDEFGLGRVNYVGNYYKPGPGSTSDFFVSTDPSSSGFEIYVQGNICPARPTDNLPQELAVKPDSVQWLVPNPHAAPPISTLSAQGAWSAVPAQAGAWPRDDVDLRVVLEAHEGTGGFIDDPSAVGGWPVLEPGEPQADSDHDGMSDSWERQNGLDPEDPEDGSGDQDGDGYTNLEEYLNKLACSAPAHVVLSEQSVSTDEIFRACISLTAGAGFSILSGANVLFDAGDLVVLETGFSVDLGASFAVLTDVD